MLFQATNGGEWGQLTALVAQQLGLPTAEMLLPAFQGNLIQVGGVDLSSLSGRCWLEILAVGWHALGQPHPGALPSAMDPLDKMH